MRELLEFIGLMKSSSDDLGEIIPNSVSELRKRGVALFDEGLSCNKGVTSFFQNVEPMPTSCSPIAADVVVRHQNVTVKVYNADGEQVGERTETRPVLKTVRVDRLSYMSAKTPAERALVRACEAFDKRPPNRPKNHFMGHIKTLHGQLTRAGLRASHVNALCTAVRDVCRGDSDSVCFRILSDLKASENAFDTATAWLKRMLTIRKAVLPEDEKLDRYAFESLEGTARAMGTTVDLMLQHGAYMGVVSKNLYSEIPEDGQETPGDFFIEHVPGDHIWNTRRAQMVERVEEEDILRRHNVKSRSVPIITAGDVRVPQRDMQGEFELPVWDIILTRINDGKMFYRQVVRTYHEIAGHAAKVNKAGRFSYRFQRARTMGGSYCNKCNNRYFTDIMHHMRVKHGVCTDISEVKTWLKVVRATTLGRVTERPGWHIGCECGHYQVSPVDIMGKGWKPMPELNGITLTEILSLAGLDEMADTRFRDPEFVPGMGMPMFLNAQAVKQMISKVCGDLYHDWVKEQVSKHACHCGKPLMFHRHGNTGKDGRFWPQMVRCINTEPLVFNPGTVENNIIVDHDTDPSLIGAYVESIDDTHLIQRRNWMAAHPKVQPHIDAVKAAPSLVKAHSYTLRAKAAADLKHQEMRLFESVLNAEVRSRMLNEALESDFVQGFMQSMFNTSHGDFYAVRAQLLRGLFGRDRTGAEKDFCFAFMNALEEELRADALALISSHGRTNGFTVFVKAIKTAGYILFSRLQPQVEVAPVPPHELYLLQQVCRARRHQLMAMAQPTTTREKWRLLLQNGTASPKQAKAISIAASMAKDNELRQLAIAHT